MKLLYTVVLILTTSLAIAGGCTPPSIISEPSNSVVCENGDTYFRVLATGPSLVYQWQVDQGSGFVNLLNVAPYSGVTSDSLIITTAPLSIDNTIYRCIVSNGCVPNDTSAARLLKINVAHSISSQPSNSIACEGSVASFSLTGSGTGLTYQWQVDAGSGFVNVPSGLPYSGETTANLSITGVTSAFDGYLYQCIVSGSCSASLTSNTVSLTVNTLPDITAQPNFVNVCDGNTTSISITANGTGITYQWQVNTGSGYSNLSNSSPYSGVTTPTLDINPAAVSMNGYSYQCIVSGTCSPADTSYEIVLIVHPTYSLFTNATICQGDTLVFGSSNLTAPGFYSNLFTSVNGCDSMVYLSLNVNSAYFTTTAGSICNGDSVLLGTTYQSTAGVYTFILPTVNGCDSTIEHTLSIRPSYLYESTTTICAGDSAMVFGVYESIDSVYSQNYTTILGCDSIYTHTLIVGPVYNIALTANICAGDSILIDTTYESASGIFVNNYSSMYGCDSTVTTTLNVHPVYSLTQSISICATDSVFLAGAYQNTSGVYTDSLSTAYGCDSVIVTTLTATAIPIVVLDFNDSIFCHWDMPLILTQGLPGGGTYSGMWVTGGDTFSPTFPDGMFGITYTYTDSSGCSASSSDSLQAEICEGVVELINDADFLVYPNPFAEEFTIVFKAKETVEFKIYNVLGKLEYAQQLNLGTSQVKLSDLASGVYFAEIASGNNKIVKKLIKK